MPPDLNTVLTIHLNPMNTVTHSNTDISHIHCSINETWSPMQLSQHDNVKLVLTYISSKTNQNMGGLYVNLMNFVLLASLEQSMIFCSFHCMKDIQNHQSGYHLCQSEYHQSAYHLCQSAYHLCQSAYHLCHSQYHQSGYHLCQSQYHQSGYHLCYSQYHQSGYHLCQSQYYQSGYHVCYSQYHQSAYQLCQSQYHQSGYHLCYSEYHQSGIISATLSTICLVSSTLHQRQSEPTI